MRFLAFLFLLFLVGMTQPLASARAQEFSTPLAGSATPTLTPTLTAALPAINLSYPAAGETLRGEVPISGLVNLPGLTAWELAFAYAEDSTDTWFVLAQGQEPASGELLRWNTQTLADGVYRLRLRAFLGAEVREIQVAGLKVRNYTFDTPTPLPSPTFTRTPARTLPPRPPSQTPVPTLTTHPTHTPYPPNPASLSDDLVWFSFARGALLTLALFALFAWLLWVRRKS